MAARPPNDDEPVTLKEACEIVFRNTITPATLRAEAARGRLSIRRIGKRDFTTLRSVKELMQECPEGSRPRASISTPSAANGSSETDRLLSAQAALKLSVDRLRSISRNTSGKSTPPLARQTR